MKKMSFLLFSLFVTAVFAKNILSLGEVKFSPEKTNWIVLKSNTFKKISTHVIEHKNFSHLRSLLNREVGLSQTKGSYFELTKNMCSSFFGENSSKTYKNKKGFPICMSEKNRVLDIFFFSKINKERGILKYYMSFKLKSQKDKEKIEELLNEISL